MFLTSEGECFVSVVDHKHHLPSQQLHKLKQEETKQKQPFRAWLNMSSFSFEEEEKKDEIGDNNVFYWEAGMSSGNNLNSDGFKKRKRRPKMIVFDKDGTLGDDAASLRLWINHMTACLTDALNKKESSESEIIEIVQNLHNRLGWDSTADRGVPSAPLAAGTWEESVETCCNYVAQYCGLPRTLPREWHSQLKNVHGSDPPIIPNTPEMIQKCRDLGLIVAICTSDDREPTNSSLKNWNIDNMIDFSICGDEVTTPKPSALPLQILCERANVQPEDCIIVGDTTGDTGMARNAKAGLCVGVLSGSGVTEQLIETGADIVLPNVGHIPELLHRLGIQSNLL